LTVFVNKEKKNLELKFAFEMGCELELQFVMRCQTILMAKSSLIVLVIRKNKRKLKKTSLN